jgi:dTDP-glucose pyrophosphorylase
MNRLQIVLPMAGQGQRFADAGYALPKPLIPVSGLPMVVRAVRDLPPAERVILLVRQEHQKRFDLDGVLKHHLPQAVIVPVERLTDGQACTVRLAAEHLDPTASVIVGACDNTHVYDREQLARRMSDPELDALIWTYRNDTRVLAKPTAYGWVRTEGMAVQGVSCKVPLGPDPLHDHAVSGFFSFRRADLMIEAIDRMVAADTRTNGEFYMDTVPNLLLAAGRRVEVFEVEKYIGWGTPAEYEDYLRFERYVRSL